MQVKSLQPLTNLLNQIQMFLPFLPSRLLFFFHFPTYLFFQNIGRTDMQVLSLLYIS